MNVRSTTIALALGAFSFACSDVTSGYDGDQGGEKVWLVE